MPLLLIVHDDRSVGQLFRHIYQHSDITVQTAVSAKEAEEHIARRAPDIVVLDIVLPDDSGLRLFQRIHREDPTVPVVFLTGSSGSQTAIEAMKLGAFEYLVKPLDVAKIREILDQALKVRRFMHSRVRMSGPAEGAPDGDVLVGHCPAMQEVYKAIGRVASQNVNVLICGESGTGKELVARAIYQHGPRASGPFLAVNCAAIPETLLESELFGHEKGSFTGADSRRIGKFEQCNGGTLFLDEIGDMTPLMQSKVLRVLQEKRFERIGGNETIETDVWIIAATNRDLDHMVNHGQFRADLYYRLTGFTIQLPPLRERVEDIPSLVRHFLRQFAAESGKPAYEVPPEALELLMRYAWPGNVRQLQSVLKRALLQSPGPLLLPEFLPWEVRTGQAAAAESAGTAQAQTTLDGFVDSRLRAGTQALYAEALALMERHVLAGVLRHTRGNQSRAAKILGITRGSLRNKARALGITVSPQVSVDEEPVEAAP